MQPCPEYEDRILDYGELPPSERAEVDCHLSTCHPCLQFQQALREVDQGLERALADVRLRAVAADVLRKAQTPPKRPSLLPEVLDFAGWTSVTAAVVAAVLVIAPLQEPLVWLALSGAVVAGSGWFGVRSWQEMK